MCAASTSGPAATQSNSATRQASEILPSRRSWPRRQHLLRRNAPARSAGCGALAAAARLRGSA
eukprot:7562887-Alexandrium_andersonii.AAC.1